MRRVRASIQVGRRGKRNKETKGLQGGGAPRGAGLRPGRVSPGQESPVPETQELHQPSWGGKGLTGSWSRTQEGGDALGLPGTLTDTCARESAPSSLRAAARTAGPGAARGGSGAAPRRGLRGPGARIHQRRLRSTGRRDTAQDPASPGTGSGREGPGQRGRSCPS